MLKNLDTFYQKDAYVIINGFYEEQVKIPPSNSFWTAGHFIADSHSKYTNLPNSYIDYIQEIDCAIDKSYHICSSEGVSIIGQFYDWLKANHSFNLTSYPAGISEYAIPFMLESNLYFNGNPNVNENMIKRKELTITTNPNNSNFDIVLPFYFRDRLLYYTGSILTETQKSATYGSGGFVLFSMNLIRSLFKINKNNYVNIRPKDGTYDYFELQGDNYVLSNATYLGLMGSFLKSANKGIEFFITPSVYQAPYRMDINQNTINELIGVIYTDIFVYLLYGQNNYIKLVQVYQRRPADFNNYFEYAGVKYYKNFDLVNGTFEYVGTIFAPPKTDAIGITIKYIYPYYINITFHDRIFGTDYDEKFIDERIRDSVNNYDSVGARYRTSLNVRALTQRNAFAMHDKVSTIKMRYPMANNENKIVVDPSVNVRPFLNAFYGYGMYIGCPAYSKQQFIISGDKFTGILYGSQVSVSPNLGYIEVASPFVGKFNITTNIFKRVLSRWEPMNINTPQTVLNEDLDYVANNDSVDLPSQTRLPVYRFAINIDWNLEYGNIIPSYRLSTVPVPFYSATITQAGLFIQGYLRVPSKVVIPTEDILRISINRGSVFDEHAVVEIWNEDGKYDFLKRLTEYTAIIAADYTKEYMITNNPTFIFQNNISASELGIPENCIAVFRGLSDIETPLSYIVQKVEGDGLKRQEIIRLNLHGIFYKVKQAVPLIAESFNSYTHINAIRDILTRVGINATTDFIAETNHPDSDMILMPPIPQFNSGWTLEPPNNYGDFVRKIINEFSGWWFYYRHLNGKFYYHPRDFLVYPRNNLQYIKFYSKNDNFVLNYETSPMLSLLATDLEVKVQRPIATQVVLYGGTVYPLVKSDYVVVNRRAVEDPSYDFYVGRNKTVFVYSPITEPKTLELILRELSYRMLIGHKIANIKFIGWLGTGIYNFCYVEPLNSYGIIKSSSVDYDGTNKYFQGEAEIELANYVSNDGRQYAIFWDEL